MNHQKTRRMRRIYAKATITKRDPEDPDNIIRDEEDNIMYEEIEVYLHHWGLQYETIEDKNGNLHVGMYTVAICEDLNTGRIHTFMPNQLKLEGTTTYQ